MRRTLHTAKPIQGGTSKSAQRHRRRRAEWGRLWRKGGPEGSKAAKALYCARGGLTATRGIKGIRQAALMRQAWRERRAEREAVKAICAATRCPPLLPIHGATCPKCSFAYGASSGRGHELAVCSRNCCTCGGTQPGHLTKRPAYALVKGRLIESEVAGNTP